MSAENAHNRWLVATSEAADNPIESGELLFIHSTRESSLGGYIATASRFYPPSGDGYLWAQPGKFQISTEFLEWLPPEASGR